MSRTSLAATAVAAAVAGALVLPALPASAAVASSARLTSPTSVFPGGNTFTVSVTNNEASGLLTSGASVNVVRINFPVSEAGTTLNGLGTAPSGWTVTATNLGTTQYLTYRGGTIAPGATTAFTFPAAIARPAGSDRRGDFRVQVSSDDAKSFSSAAAPVGSTLFETVKVLEIAGGTLKPIAPVSGTKGVGDRSGTAGQDVTYGLNVVNHASGPVSVTPALTSTDASDKPGSATAVSVPGNDGNAALTVPLHLGNAPAGGQLARVLTAAAAGSTSYGSSAASTVDDTFTVQAPVTFSATELTPLRTKSGTGSARTFTARVAKAGVQGASVDSSTFAFGTNSKATGPLSFGGGALNQVVSYPFTSVTGDPGDLAATIANAGTDDNLAPLNGTPFRVGTITIDNVAPVLTIDAQLPNDGDGDRQTASSNNDVVTVTGTVKGTDLSTSSLKVALTTDNGKSLPVSVTPSTTSDGLSFTGTVNVGTWDAGSSRFSPTATIDDTATNNGTVTGLSTPIDTALPTLRSPAVILTPTTIELKFLDPSGVRGGCDPAAYAVSGKPGAVTAVKGNGDQPCDPHAASDGVRTLVLGSGSALSTTELPTVTYSPLNRTLGFLPAKDGAGNDAASATAETVSRLTPLAPVLNLVERRDGGTSTGAFEAAYLDKDEARYYTNAAGADGNRVTVGGVRNGYVLQVRDAAGTVLTQTGAFSNTSPVAPSEYTGSSALPLGTAAGSYDRYLTFAVPATGRVSPATKVTLVLDQTLPTIASAAMTSPTNVRAAFAEPVVVGSDSADDWFVTEQVATETGTAGRTVNVNAVAPVDQTHRDLTVELLDPSKYQKADYYFQSPSGTRYEDRAGNALKSTLVPVV